MILEEQLLSLKWILTLFQVTKILLTRELWIFICGIGYLSSIIGFEKAVAAGLLPFIPSELFKIALAVFIIPTIWKYIQK